MDTVYFLAFHDVLGPFLVGTSRTWTYVWPVPLAVLRPHLLTLSTAPRAAPHLHSVASLSGGSSAVTGAGRGLATLRDVH